VLFAESVLLVVDAEGSLSADFKAFDPVAA
jgi:hypothetical protein